MKLLKKILIAAVSGGTITALALTTFTGPGINSDGSAFTNQIVLQAYPPANNITIYGTNFVFGNRPITITPNANGSFTNSAMPNQYSVTFVGLNVTAYAQIPDTTNIAPFASYLTNAPVVGGGGTGGFAYITNLLGYTPLQSNSAAIIGALNYTPATNTYAGIAAAQGFFSATNQTFSLTGTFTYTNGSGSRSTFYITNGIVITNTTP